MVYNLYAMNDDICDIFDDADILDTDAIVYEMVSGESGGGMGLDRAQTDTPAGRISTLSELFLEWYLFDSSEEKDVKKFLAEAEIQDVLNEAQFMDLMCGMAYLDDDLLQLISLKLPFPILSDKLHRMNAKVATSKKAYKIESKSDVADKIKDQAQQKERARKDRKNARKRELYAQNPEKYKEQGRRWRAKNPDKVRAKKRRDWAKHATEYNAKRREKRKENREALLAKARQWYADHREERRAYEKMRRERDRESRKAVQKRSVEKNKEHYAQYKHAWYEAHKAQLSQQGKDRYQQNKAQIQQGNKDRYEKNKEQYLAQRKLYRAELKQKTESAQKICAAYVFLMNLRKTNREKYLELYTRQQKPLTSMLKTCAALQKMDINLCPFCNSNSEQTVETCCNPKVLSLPDAISELQIISANLMKNRAQNGK